MKWLMTFLICLFLASSAFGDARVMMLATKKGVASQYLINEGFEAGTEPANWWHSGTVLYNNTSPTIDGTYNARIAGGGSSSSGIGWTPMNTVYISTHIIVAVLPSLEYGYISVRDSGNAVLGALQITSAGKLTAITTGGTNNTSSGNVVTGGTALYLKIKVVIGTGSNGICTIWSSTDGTTWTQRASSTNGTTTTQPSYVTVVAPTATGTHYVYIDTVKVSASDITDARSGF